MLASSGLKSEALMMSIWLDFWRRMLFEDFESEVDPRSDGFLFSLVAKNFAGGETIEGSEAI